MSFVSSLEKGDREISRVPYIAACSVMPSSPLPQTSACTQPLSLRSLPSARRSDMSFVRRSPTYGLLWVYPHLALWHIFVDIFVDESVITGLDNGSYNNSPVYVTLYLIPSRDDVIKWKYFPRYWPFVRGIHRSPVDSPHNSQWRGALALSWIRAWTNGWANKRVACVLKRHRAHYDVTVTIFSLFPKCDDNYKNRVKLENHCYDRNDTDGVSGLYKVSEHPSCCRISAPVRWRLSFSATCSENLWLTRTCLTPR